MEVVHTQGSDERFVQLCVQLDDFLNELVGGEKQRAQYAQYNTLQDIHDVVLIIDSGDAVGCGGIKRYDDNTAEVKRVFVDKNYRKKHYGSTIIKELENIARTKGFTRLILETGKPLVGAMKMYEKLGFGIIDNYGPYVDLKESICMEKVL